MSPEPTKVLVIGAGGIGCELLKNLVLSGFHDIEVVDLDTIELSNLNRQFLFRRRHIGKYKAEVAAEAVRAMNAKASVVAHVGNILDTDKFPFSFFEKFKIVLNALDNINARRYVNGICLALNIPLVESGTAGYHGQCTVILPRKSECYDCVGKDAPKTFAVCTIRSTPSAPIHCVVWAKDYLLPHLFGEKTPDEIPAEIEDDAHIESLKAESDAFNRLRGLANSKDDSFATEVFNKVFHDDLEAIRTIAALWESREPPKSYDLAQINVPRIEEVQALNDQNVWTIDQWTALLFDSLKRLSQRLPSIIGFDKDDQDTLDFVASVANLRANAYGIPMTSRFALKALAGNIIPAIATTNAIAAGMIVIQANNILAGKYENLADFFITSDASRKNYFLKSNISPPNPECKVCFVHRAHLRCNTGHFTLGEVIDKVIPMFLKKLSDSKVTTECLSILESSRMIYDEEDMPQSRAKTLADLKVADSKFLRFEFLDGLPLVMAVQNDDSFSTGEFGCTFDILPVEQIALGVKRSVPQDDDDDDSSDLEVVQDEDSDFEILEPSATRLKISED